jgi:hypothetical protein
VELPQGERPGRGFQDLDRCAADWRVSHSRNVVVNASYLH